jgi:outer membrane protein assembly factor BamA
MTKLKLLLLAFGLLTLCKRVGAQSAYPVRYTVSDSAMATTPLQKEFASRTAASEYLAALPALLQTKGFIAASIDSLQLDSTSAVVHLYLGPQYKWARIKTSESDADILGAIRWNSKQVSGTALNFAAVQAGQERILAYLEETGYPFAKIYLDSIRLEGAEVAAHLVIDRGPLYKIDSLRVYGDARIDNQFLQRFLDISNGSIYNKKKLQAISARLAELTYVQEEYPSNITMLGTGSVLNLYLKAKKSSQVNVLLGFLPNSNAAEKKRFLITGEANILLRNSLGAGETIGLNWQQLQVNSPRLNLLYDHPFIFRSPLGLSFSMDMLRKDTTFLNVNMKLGTTYVVGGRQSATVFLQRRTTIVNGVNVQSVLQTRRLPQDADVSSVNLGVGYDVFKTDYRLNPRKGSEWNITASAGTKKLKKNNLILELKDPRDSTFDYARLYDTVKLKAYQFRVQGYGAHYFPLGRQSAIKTAINAGIFSSENIYRNELFQIGGYKLLRGFDEESQFVSQYAVATLEYRYLIGQNSAFFAFVDGGWARHPFDADPIHNYLGTGLGLSFETKAGIFNLVWAVGRREDTGLNLRQSKVHLGFVNYF